MSIQLALETPGGKGLNETTGPSGARDVRALAFALATALHEDWRNGYQAGQKSNPANNGIVPPRWKDTTDTAWLERNASQAYCDVAGKKVNIDIPLENLPEDWSKENICAGIAAVTAVQEAIEGGAELTPESIETLSAGIHDDWLRRREQEEVENAARSGKPLEKVKADSFFRKQGQDKPYAELPESEQAKDRNQVLLAIKLIKGE